MRGQRVYVVRESSDQSKLILFRDHWPTIHSVHELPDEWGDTLQIFGITRRRIWRLYVLVRRQRIRQFHEHRVDVSRSNGMHQARRSGDFAAENKTGNSVSRWAFAASNEDHFLQIQRLSRDNEVRP